MQLRRNSMHKTELKAGNLIGYRVYAVDGEAGAVRDLVLEPMAWQVRYLVVGADAWAPDHEVLVAPRSLGGVDEVRREVETELSIDEVRNSPALAAGSPVVRDFEENWYRHHGWQAYWQAEIDVETAPEPPVPPAPPADAPLPAEANADEPGLLRLEGLRGWQAVTTDKVPLPVVDLLLDDSDWRIDFFEVGLDGGGDHCLVDEDYVIGADPEAECLYLAIDSAALRQAPRRPYPGPGDGELPTLERG
jgi:hypothetical protein